MQTFDPKAFLEFCRSKPADETYPPNLVSKCALAQFGFEGASHGTIDRLGIPLPVYEAAVVGRPPDFTFGRLADRLEQALAEQVSVS